jgi:glutaredoxin 3
LKLLILLHPKYSFWFVRHPTRHDYITMGNIFSGSGKNNGVPKADSMSAVNAMKFVDTEIASHPVVVFSKTYCGYCSATKKLLAVNYAATPVQVHELDTMSSSAGDAIQQALLDKTGQRTVPSVFVGGQHIGGNSETTTAHKSGNLAQLIKQAAIHAADTAYGTGDGAASS